jgi:DNA-binding transcriptional regulator YiaG
MVTSQRIKETRARLGESQEIFAVRFNVDQSTIHRWEKGGVPDRGTTPIAVDRVLAELETEGAAQ